MAVNVTVRDLDNYPDNNKTVTVDQSTLVPTGAEGDEKWVLSFTTTAYSDNTNLTAIQDIYVRSFKAGWAKTSGFNDGPYTIQSGRQVLGLSIDGSSTYYIQLDTGSYGGNTLSDHIQEKISEVPDSAGWQSTDDALAFKNALSDFIDGKLYIISGNVSSSYTGTSKSSVTVTASGADTLYTYLGFDLGSTSETLAGTGAKEGLVTQNYTAYGSTLTTELTDADVTAGDAMAIMDASNSDYFIVEAISGTNITVGSGIAGIANNYTANESKVQLLRVQDPDGEPKMYHSTIDSITRWGIHSISNQIDYSS